MKSQQVARGLNQIASRVAKNEDALREYGVEVKDSNGQLRSTYDILSDLAPKWKTMSSEQKVALGTTLSGVNQYKVFAAVMNNFDTALAVSEDSLQSMGMTEQQNAVYMQSLSAKVNELRQAFEKLVIGDGGLVSFAKLLLDIITGALKLINVLGGLKTILIAVTGAILAIKLNSIVKTFKEIPKVISSTTSSLKLMVNGLLAAISARNADAYAATLEAAAMDGVTVSATLAQAAIGGLTAVITIGVMAFSAYKAAQEESKRKEEERVETLRQEIDQIDNVITSLGDEKLTREQLYKLIKGTGAEAHKSELDNIADENEARREAIKLLKEERDEKARDIVRTQKDDYSKALKAKEKDFSLKSIDVRKYEGASPTSTPISYFAKQEGVKWDASNLDNYVESLGKLIDHYQGLDKLSSGQAMVLDEVTKEYTKQKEELDGYNKTIEKYLQAKYEAGLMDEEEREEYEKTHTALTKLDEDYNQRAQQFNITEEEIQSYIEANGLLAENEEDASLARYEAIDSLIAEKQKIVELEQAVKDVSTTIDDLQDAMDKTKIAIDEINSSGDVSLDTFQDLMSVSADNLALVLKSAEGVDYASSAMAGYINALKEAKGAELAQAAAEDIKNLEMGKVSELSPLAQAALNGVNAKLYSTANQATQSAGALRAFNSELSKISGVNYTPDTYKIINAYRNIAKQIDSMSVSTNSYTKSTQKATEATKAHTKELEEQKKVLEEEVKIYDTVISYIKKKLQGEITAIGEKYDKLLDKLEKNHNATLKILNEELDKLKEQNDELDAKIEREKLLEELERAKSQKVKVYREGQGYVYEQDQEAVSKAQQNLLEFDREQEYQRQIKALEDKIEAENNLYEKEKEALKQSEEAEKKYFEDWLKIFEDGVNAYENEQNRLKALQLTGIDFEQQGWQQRLSNLNNFVANYKNKLAELQAATDAYNKSQSVSSSSGGSGGGGGGTQTPQVLQSPTVTTEPAKTYRVYKVLKTFSSAGEAQSNISKLKGDGVVKVGNEYRVYKWASSNRHTTSSNAVSEVNLLTATHKALGLKTQFGFKTYASGASSVGSNQMAIVGEDPNKEIVLGSKINNGVRMKLEKGSGVVNATSTKTLAGILNQLGSFSSKGFGNSVFNSTDSVSKSTNITIGSISLPQVSNGKDFVDYLQNFSLDMVQKSYT